MRLVSGGLHARAAQLSEAPTTPLIPIRDRLPGRVTGTTVLVFSIYSSDRGGTPLFQEVQRVRLIDGRFVTLLGRMTPGGVPDSIFQTGGSFYVGVSWRGRPDRQLGIRVPMTFSEFLPASAGFR